ncbi:1-acyl-sn-glycerol-3-phosphate acyltransferase alpha [Penaeus vannamei]|uniref:1-acyl-sn-glycerol-3-phosphate acyltransferase n=1 Tax=Penaeus vannamei TaxID=6689 RepID=A0A423TR19_PENVA|nr:1-acyl-sn-glycerol-3-phosphate acyltransferase alpha [Penaeus vannamei]
MLACDYTNALIAIVMIMPFVYEFSHRFRLYLKFFLFYASVMLCSVLCIPFIIWRPGDVRNTLIATLPLQLLNPLLGLHWEVKGQEHITVDRAAIVVANHQSSVDFLGMVYMWPMFEKITAIAKKELFYAMPFGMTAWLCGTRFIDRGNPERAKMSMNKALEYVTEEKVKLWVFPEGTRSMADEMLPFKKGAFHLAIEGQLPVLPVVYSSYRGFLNHSLKIFNPDAAGVLGPGAADPRRGPLRTQASLEGHLHGTGMLRSPADGQDTRTTSGAAATTLSGATSTMGGRIPVGGVKLPGMNEAQMGQMKPQGMQDAAGNLVPGAGGPNAQGTSSVTPGMSTVTTSAHDPLAANKPFGAGAQQQGLMNSQMNTNMSNIVSTQPNSHISNAVSNQTNAQISSQRQPRPGPRTQRAAGSILTKSDAEQSTSGQQHFGAGNLPGTQMGNHIQPGGTLPNQHMSNQPNQMTDVGQMNQMNQMQNAMALSGLSSLFGLQKNRPGKPHALHPSLLPRLLCLQVSASCKYLVVERHTQW